MEIALLNFFICLLNILASHILLTRKKSVRFCVITFILNTLVVFCSGYIAAGYIQDPFILEYIFTFFGFLYVVYIYLVFNESGAVKIFTMFSIWIFSFISFFIAVQFSILFPGIIADKYILEFIWLLSFGIQLLLMAAAYFWLGKLYKGIISMVPDKIINFMSLYPITAFLLLKSSSFSDVDNSRSIFLVPLFIAFIILGYLVTFVGISASSKVELQRYMANYDVVTGIANRANIMNRLADTMEISERKNLRFALFICDLDGFKNINDEYGHIIGDKALKHAAQALQRALDKADIVGRFGGDEFLIIQPLVGDAGDTEVLIGRIFEELNIPLIVDDISINLDISIGVSIFPDNAAGMEALINQADSAMYQAKKRAGCTFSFFKDLT